MKRMFYVFILIFGLAFTGYGALESNLGNHEKKAQELIDKGSYDQALIEYNYIDVQKAIASDMIKRFGQINAFICLIFIFLLLFKSNKKKFIFKNSHVKHIKIGEDFNMDT